MRLYNSFNNILMKKSLRYYQRYFFSQPIKEEYSSSLNIAIHRTKQMIISSQKPTTLPSKSHYQTFPVEHYQIGQRFDRYLKNSHMNWTLVQKYLRNKQIYIVNKSGKRVKQNSYRLQQGDIMYIKSQIAAEMFVQKQGLDVGLTYEQAKEKIDEFVIFDNKNITILNKPSGYSVQGGDNYQRNMFSLMAARYKREMVYVIHRLDKPTTGVLFFCKNLKTAQLIQSAIQSRKDYNKYYLALSIGKEIPKSQEYIRCNIEWTNKHKARVIQSMEKELSKDSITYYKKLYSQNVGINGNILNLLGIKLITGRKHQIRCHLSDYLNNPIVNDKKYCAALLSNLNDNKKDNQNKNTNQEKKSKDDQGFIFLHALMTVIKNDEILSNVFEISNEKIQASRNSNSIEVVHNSANGAVLMKNGQLKILGNLPKHWQNINTKPHQSTNIPDLKQIVLNYNMNEIQIAQQIQKSQSNLWKKHRPQRKVMTIE